MDEISGLLLSGGVLLAASILKGNHSTQEEIDEVLENEETIETKNKTQRLEEEKFDENVDRELRKQRKRYDAEFENILRNTASTNNRSLIILGNPFYTSFHKLQDALQTIQIPSVINTNIKQRYLLVQLGQWFLFKSALYDPNSTILPHLPDDTLLFQLLVSNGLVLIPGSAFGSSEPGSFVVTRDVQDDEIIRDIVDRIQTVQAILEKLHSNQSQSGIETAAPVSVDSETLEAQTSSKAKTTDENDFGDDDVSVSSRTRGKKRVSSSSIISSGTISLPSDPDTATKRKKRQQTN